MLAGSAARSRVVTRPYTPRYQRPEPRCRAGPAKLLQYCWNRCGCRIEASDDRTRCRFARQVRGMATARRRQRVGDNRMTPDPIDNTTTTNVPPKPTPRPGPRPGARPGPRPPAYLVAAHAPSDPHQFGRLDDDGTVWLIGSA